MIQYFREKKHPLCAPTPLSSLVQVHAHCGLRVAAAAAARKELGGGYGAGTSSQEAGVNNQLVYGVDQIKRSSACMFVAAPDR